jgi:hypothetical protein
MKKLKISFVREAFNKAITEQITFSKFVELLNEETGFKIAPYENTGVELISHERFEQIVKHQRKIRDDFEINGNRELITVAVILMDDSKSIDNCPIHWNREIFEKMFNKPYKDRLIIAGALIAAELDRLNYKG